MIMIRYPDMWPPALVWTVLSECLIFICYAGRLVREWHQGKDFWSNLTYFKGAWRREMNQRCRNSSITVVFKSALLQDQHVWDRRPQDETWWSYNKVVPNTLLSHFFLVRNWPWYKRNKALRGVQELTAFPEATVFRQLHDLPMLAHVWQWSKIRVKILSCN